MSCNQKREAVHGVPLMPIAVKGLVNDACSHYLILRNMVNKNMDRFWFPHLQIMRTGNFPEDV